MRRLIPIFLGIFVSIGTLSAKSLFEQGEDLFMQNKPAAAAALLEGALNESPSDPRVYLYLGICYEQQGEHQKAIDILKRGTMAPGADLSLLYYDMGNNYVALKDAQSAEEMYTKAIQVKSSFAAPYLNRANIRVGAKQYKQAIDDYTIYLNLKPADPQAPQIQKMIALLQGEVTAEQKRIADAAKLKAEEEAKRKALLDSVLNSLDNAPSDTTNLSGGNAQIENKTEPLDIAP